MQDPAGRRGRHARHAVLAASFLLVLLAGALVPACRRFEDLSADLRQALRYALRQQLRRAPAIPGNRQVCLVGIDERTLIRFGKFGTGLWAVRDPFIRFLPVLRLYQPSAVAFDILFRPSGETADSPPDPDVGPRLFAELRAWTEPDAPPAELQTLQLMTRFAAEQAEHRFAAALFDLSSPPDPAVPPVPVIAAYDFRGTRDTAADSARAWSRRDILGPDPNAPAEARGETIPYLLDVAIPPANLSRIPADYPYAVNATLPTPVVRDAVRHGFINVPRDPDGLIRRLPLVMGFAYRSPLSGETRRVFVPSLALLTVLHHWGLTPADVQVEFGRCLRIRRAPGGPLCVPVDAHGRLYLNFTGRITDFPTISLVQLLGLGEHDAAERNGAVTLSAEQRQLVRRAEKLLRGQMAVIGLTGTGTTDIGPCPIDPNTPYVHIHLTAIANLLDRRVLTPLTPAGQWLLLLLLAGLYTPLCFRRRLRHVVLATVLLGAGYLLLAFLAMEFTPWVLPVVTPGLYLGGTFLAVLAARYATEEQAKRRIRRMFTTMVSPQVLRYMEENPAGFSLAGHRVEATVMFSDLAGSTGLSERLPPEELVAMLNLYFNAMTDVILRSGGYLDKFEGDGIMAVWGVPFPAPDHAATACGAALDQVAALRALQPELRRRWGVQLQARFGLNAGPVIAGNMGSERRFQYTVMGETVNLAARLEPAGKDYGTTILLGENVWRQAGPQFRCRLLDRVLLAGSTHPTQLYELLGRRTDAPPPGQEAWAQAYENGLTRLWDRDWDGAEAAFREAQRQVPGDAAARLQLARLRLYRLHPPPPGWQGETLRAAKG